MVTKVCDRKLTVSLKTSFLFVINLSSTGIGWKQQRDSMSLFTVSLPVPSGFSLHLVTSMVKHSSGSTMLWAFFAVGSMIIARSR